MKAIPSTILLLALFLPGVVSGRIWKSSEGKEMEAEFVISDGANVTIKKAGGKSYTLALDRFSEADRVWVAAKLKEMEEEKGAVLKEKGLSGKWERREDYGVEYRLFGGTSLDPEKI